MEVTPCGPDQNYYGLAALGDLRLPLPSPGQKRQKNLKQQSSDGTECVGVVGTARGLMEVTPLRPPVVLVLGFGAFPAQEQVPKSRVRTR